MEISNLTRFGIGEQAVILIVNINMVGFFDRIIIGKKGRGCRVDPITRQTIQFMPHSGDVEYDLVGDDAVSKKSEFVVPTREIILNPKSGENLNGVGQNKDIIERTADKRHVKLD